jgi:rhamnose transport system substrate-binding protein
MRLIASILSLALAGGLLAGCNPPKASTGGAGGDGVLRIGLMPKQKGIPYFNACEQGAREAAAELGDVELTYDGPIEDKSEDQSAMLDTWVLRQFDAIAVACNDPAQISTSLSRARQDGVVAITWDADADPRASQRQFFVNQVDGRELAVALVDEMARQAGEDAKIGVVSSSSTAPNQTAWLKLMETYRAERYPHMQILQPEYAGENQVRSFEKATNLLKAHPDVKGVFGMTSVALPGAAQAVERAGKAGQVAVIGLGTPNDMRPFVKNGVVETIILWNPVELGYLTVYVARAAAKGELRADSTTFNAGRLGEKKVENGMVLLGKPMIFTAENIDEFDF